MWTTVLAVVLFLYYVYCKWSFTYWKRLNVPYIEPSIPFGTSENPFSRKEYVGFRIKRFYDHFKRGGHKYGGLYFFTSPVYLPVQVDCVKSVMTKHFSHFRDRGVYCNEKSDPLTANLFFLTGDRWKTIRSILTPAFTASKIKMMFPILIQCGHNLKSAVKGICAKTGVVDIKQISSCYTIDVIGSCAFGLDVNSFTNPNNEFVKQGENFFTSFTQLRSLSVILSLAVPKLALLLNVQTIPNDITKFFLETVKNTVEFREKNKYFRKDFMQIMIDFKNNGEKFSIREMAAQAFAFFVAGYDTSSTTISLCLYEIAKNNHIQQKIREEIVGVLKKHHGVVTYDAVLEMHYLDQVIDETLRKYPPVALMTRVCTEDYQVSKDVIIKKGTKVAIPIYALHHDEEYFPEPSRFDPERFSETCNKPGFAYIPFGAGPRICTGLRIGLLQTKIAVMSLLESFSFSINVKTSDPLEFQNANFALKVKNGIWLDILELP